MANDAALGLLGLSRKAGRLALGEDQVYDSRALRVVLFLWLKI